MTVKELMLSNLIIGHVRLVKQTEPTDEPLTEIITDRNWSPMAKYYDMTVVGVTANVITKITESGAYLAHYFTDILVED